MSPKRQATFNGYGRGQLRVLSWEYPSGERLAQHHHGWHQLIYAVAGVMTVETASGTWVVPANRAVWVPARVVHGIVMSGSVSMRTLYFSPRLLGTFPGACRVVAVTPLLRELVLHAVEREGLDRRRAVDRHLLDVLIDQVTTLPADPLRILHPSEPRAARVARQVVDRPGERATLQVLAKLSGASKRTVERAFVRETGMSFGRWRQQVRLIYALQLLAAGQPVTSVALEVGYDSVSAFVSLFRKLLGTTPGRYFSAP